jgi:hypothetical protein
MAIMESRSDQDLRLRPVLFGSNLAEHLSARSVLPMIRWLRAIHLTRHIFLTNHLALLYLAGAIT